ncbi:putative beta-lysine N-acetyltransferase [Methanoculleus sp.]|uniref:putative beta-lysine N-acetyltransferase n=1 Tax=Methanoculleus sp. TaxID=90427 RepID=UPI002FC92BA4
MFSPLHDQKNQKTYRSRTGAGKTTTRHPAKNIPPERQGQAGSRLYQDAHADTTAMLGRSLVHHGPFNDRAYLFRLDPADVPGIAGRLLALARGRGYSRVFARVPAPACGHFISSGYLPRARIPGLYRGEVDGYYLAAYRDPLQGNWQDGIDDVLAVAEEKGRKGAASTPLEPEFTCTPATPADAPALATIYRKVFVTYPVPVQDPAYLAREMHHNLHCFCIRDGEKIAAIASAAVDPESKFAEMTGFATLPEYQGCGFSDHLLRQMEAKMRSIGIKTAFAIARARSYPANIIFARTGYTHAGTVPGCVNICGSLEDMSVWYRLLDGRMAAPPRGTSGPTGDA